MLLHLKSRVVGRIDSSPLDKACNDEDDQRNQKCRSSCEEKIPDMGEQRHVGDARSQVGSLAQGRHLVAEIGSRDDGTRHPAVFQSQRSADAHQSHADGGYRRPAAADADADQSTEHTRRDQQPAGRNHFQSVVDHRRYHPRMHPGAAQAAHHQQDEVGRHRSADADHHGILKLLPRQPVEHERDEHCHSRTEHQHQLRRSAQHPVAKDGDAIAEQSDQQHDGNQRNDDRRPCFLSLLHSSFVRVSSSPTA